MAMDNRSVTLVCDGTTQTLADFKGVVTHCLVKNGRYSGNVTVWVKGIKEALLAPGHAIACRTSMVKVCGPSQTTVTLEFVGPSDLVPA